MKMCGKCGKQQPESEFYMRENGKLRNDCKACVRLRNKEHYERTYAHSEHRKKSKPWLGRRKYYPSLYAAQNGRCAICGVHEDDMGRKLHVDHDHETGAIRALLCGPCNQGLGQFKDDPERLRLAADYLESHRVVN